MTNTTIILTLTEAMAYPIGQMRIVKTGRYRRCWRHYKTDFRYYGKSWYAVIDVPYRQEVIADV